MSTYKLTTLVLILNNKNYYHKILATNIFQKNKMKNNYNCLNDINSHNSNPKTNKI